MWVSRYKIPASQGQGGLSQVCQCVFYIMTQPLSQWQCSTRSDLTEDQVRLCHGPPPPQHLHPHPPPPTPDTQTAISHLDEPPPKKKPPPALLPKPTPADR